MDGWPMVSLGVGVLIMAALLQAPLVGSPGADAGASAASPAGAADAWRAGVHLIGGFRPLAVDLLWLRADALFRSGRLFELVALFRSITALDPSNRLVREFAAWHLAYNVSLAETDPDRRFAWFAEGIRILDEGRAASSRQAWRLDLAAGRMFYDRFDAGVLPRFAEKVERRFGAHPLEISRDRFAAAAAHPESGEYTHVHLLAALERLRRRALEAGDGEGAARLDARLRDALDRARRRFPAADWSFVQETR
jgi:hypothetical protein